MVFVIFVSKFDEEYITHGHDWEEALNNLREISGENVNVQDCEFYSAEKVIVKTEVTSK